MDGVDLSLLEEKNRRKEFIPKKKNRFEEDNESTEPDFSLKDEIPDLTDDVEFPLNESDSDEI